MRIPTSIPQAVASGVVLAAKGAQYVADKSMQYGGPLASKVMSATTAINRGNPAAAGKEINDLGRGILTTGGKEAGSRIIRSGPDVANLGGGINATGMRLGTEAVRAAAPATRTAATRAFVRNVGGKAIKPVSKNAIKKPSCKLTKKMIDAKRKRAIEGMRRRQAAQNQFNKDHANRMHAKNTADKAAAGRAQAASLRAKGMDRGNVGKRLEEGGAPGVGN